MGFNVTEMKAVHARLSDLIATGAQELSEMSNVMDFASDIDEDTARLLSNAAVSARQSRRCGATLTPEEEKAECLRLYAEIEAKMGRVWMKKHDLQEAKKSILASA